MLLAQLAGKIAMKNFWIKLISFTSTEHETLTHLSDGVSNDSNKTIAGVEDVLVLSFRYFLCSLV